MYKIEMYLAAAGIILGIGIGAMIVKSFGSEYESCQQLKQENQMLRDMLFNQQDPYRPDTLTQVKEVEGCDL
jgi:uncharacterized membrane-anchored protein YhcB (DUF1043 family)